MTDPIISMRNVTKVYGSGPTAFQALKGVDLDIAAGANTDTATVTAVDTTRTLLLTGSETHNFSALGETDIGTFVGSNEDLDNYVGRFSINAAGTTVTATRGGTAGRVVYTVFVVELDPR